MVESTKKKKNPEIWITNKRPWEMSSSWIILILAGQCDRQHHRRFPIFPDVSNSEMCRVFLFVNDKSHVCICTHCLHLILTSLIDVWCCCLFFFPFFFFLVVSGKLTCHPTQEAVATPPTSLPPIHPSPITTPHANHVSVVTSNGDEMGKKKN